MSLIAPAARPRPASSRAPATGAGNAAGRRAALVAATVVLGVAGHLAAGGALELDAPSPTAGVPVAGLLIAGLLVTGLLVAAVPAGGRRAGPGRTAAALASGQVALHLALGGHGAHGASAAPVTAPLVTAHGMSAHGMSAMPATGPGPVGGGPGATVAMLLAHVLVVVALAAAAGRADRAVAAVVRGAAARSRAVLLGLLRLLGRPAPPPAVRRSPLPDAPTPTVGVLFARVLPRRGPPLRCA